MDTYSAPFPTDMYLYWYEANFMQVLLRKNEQQLSGSFFFLMTTTTGANSRTPFNNMVHFMYKYRMPQLITKREGHNMRCGIIYFLFINPFC